MSLIVNVDSASDIRGVGVGIRSQGGTPRIRQNLTNVVGLIGVFPWQAAGQVASPSGGYEFTSGSDVMKTLFPLGANDAYSEIAGLEFGKLRIYNVRHSDATAGAITLDDASSGDSVTVTCRHTTPLSTRIKITVTANVDAATARDFTVKVYGADGATVIYSKKHLLVQVAASAAVTDPGDPYVIFAKASGATLVAAAVTDQALTAGSYGTIAASDYGAGITAYTSQNGPKIICPVGVSASLCDAVNELMQAAHDSAGGYGHDYIACTELGLTKAEAITAAGLIPGQHVWYPWPGIIKGVAFAFGGYSDGPTQTTVSPGATIAAAMQAVDPWVPVSMKYAARSFAAVNSLEANGLALNGQPDMADLAEAGITAINLTHNYGFVPWKEVTTATDATTDLPYSGKTARYNHYVESSIANALEADLTTPLDIDLANGLLGPNTNEIYTKIVVFMEGEKEAKRVVSGTNTSDGSASPAYVVDPLGGANATDLGNNLWTINIAYRETPTADFILLNFRHGTNINIVGS